MLESCSLVPSLCQYLWLACFSVYYYAQQVTWCKCEGGDELSNHNYLVTKHKNKPHKKLIAHSMQPEI